MWEKYISNKYYQIKTYINFMFIRIYIGYYVYIKNCKVLYIEKIIINNIFNTQ